MGAPESGAMSEESFRLLVETHARMMFRVAYRMTRNTADAEDIVQDALLKAYKARASFEERSRPSTWLHRITTNCAIDLMRKKRRLREDDMPEEGDSGSIAALVSRPASASESGFQADLGRSVSTALSTMSETERVAFVLRHYEGYSLSEIGTSLGLSLAATKQAVFRAVRKARTVLEPLVQSGADAAGGVV